MPLMPTSTKDTLNLTVNHHGKEWRYVLQTPTVQIGCGSHNDITLLDENISRDHAKLSKTGEVWRIEDLESANGTRVNGSMISGATAIGADDVIQIGDAELRFTPAQDPSTQTTQTRSTENDETMLEATVIDTPSDLERNTHMEAMDVVLPNTHIPRVVVQFAGRFWEVPLTEKGLTIGRAPENDIVLNAPKVSRNHARVELTDKGMTLIDNRSANGTFIGEEKITRRVLTGGESVHIGPATLIYKPAFSPNELGSRTKTLKARKPIVFIPGFMGSQLWLGDKLVWPNLVMLATQTDVFKLPEKTPLTVRGLVEEVVVVPNLIRQEQYSQLTDFLRESLGYEVGKDLLTFAYDWRKDLRLAANQLKEHVEAWRKTQPDPTAKVILMAHSMGSLVTRYFLDVLGGDQIAERVIFMGGPHMGTPKSIVALLTGQGLLPFGLLGNQIRDAVATFPGAYQLLPIYPAVFDTNDKPVDVFADPRWAAEPFRAHIEDAKKFRSELKPRASVPTLCIIGYGNKTVKKAVVQPGANGGWASVKFIEDEEGDSTIPVSSAILEGAEFHPVQQSHGALFVDNDVRFRLKIELAK
jgi:pSer/pThr/pTyr-binding forkhead associated (FHA) protein